MHTGTLAVAGSIVIEAVKCNIGYNGGGRAKAVIDSGGSAHTGTFIFKINQADVCWEINASFSISKIL
ncbi:hypothetical protein D3C86_1579850 [compost metagenome]